MNEKQRPLWKFARRAAYGAAALGTTYGVVSTLPPADTIAGAIGVTLAGGIEAAISLNDSERRNKALLAQRRNYINIAGSCGSALVTVLSAGVGFKEVAFGAAGFTVVNMIRPVKDAIVVYKGKKK